MSENHIVTLPFTYELEAILAKKRTPSKLIVVDGIPVDVEVLTRNEVRTVLFKQRVWSGDAPGFDMVVHEGRLYGLLTDLRFVMDKDTDEARRAFDFPIGATQTRTGIRSKWEDDVADANVPMPFDVFCAGALAAAEGKVHVDSTLLPLPLHPDPKMRRSAGTAREDLMVTKTIADGREAAEARFGAMARNAIIAVDGFVYIEEAEPRWVVDVSYGGLGSTYSTNIVLKRAHRKMYVESRFSGNFDIDFRIDQRALAVKLGEALGRSHGTPDDGWAVDMEYPWSVRVEEIIAQNWMRRIVAMMHEYGQSFLRGSDEFVEAFLDLRRASRAGDVTLRSAKERVDGIMAMIKADKDVPTEHAKRLLGIGIPIQARIDMLGFGDEQPASAPPADELDGFVLD